MGQSKSISCTRIVRTQSILCFFKNDPTGKVKGSAGVPLVPMASVASDRNVIPSGTVLLVEVPDIDNNGNWMGTHKLHLMVALDVGGAVKGHILTYTVVLAIKQAISRVYQNTMDEFGYYNNGSCR